LVPPTSMPIRTEPPLAFWGLSSKVK